MSECCKKETEKTRICVEGYKYVDEILKVSPRDAIMCCEGACIKGEIARVAANILSYQLEKSKAVRICLGDASTGNSGFVELVKKAPRVISIEGCPLKCGTEILKKRVCELNAQVVVATDLYEYDRALFEIFDMPRDLIEEKAKSVATQIQNMFFTNN